MENIIIRIRKIIDYKGISERKFCLEIGVSTGFLNKVSDVGSSKLMKILNRYPEINPTWLLTGIGEMLINYTNNINSEVEKKITDDEHTNFYEYYFVKIKRMVDLLDKEGFSELYEDVLYRLQMIISCTEHYSMFKKSQDLINETDKKELAIRIQQILNNEKALLKIISPYSDMISELHKELMDFDKKTDRLLCLDEETEKLINDSLKDIPINTLNQF